MSDIRPSSRGRRKDGQPTARSKTGLTGAYEIGGYGKWRSKIQINKKTIILRNKEGKTYFHSAEEAHEAYIKAALDHGLSMSTMRRGSML